MIEQVIASMIGTFFGLLMWLAMIGIGVKLMEDRIKGKVDDKIDEKKNEMLSDLF